MLHLIFSSFSLTVAFTVLFNSFFCARMLQNMSGTLIPGFFKDSHREFPYALRRCKDSHRAFPHALLSPKDSLREFTYALLCCKDSHR